MNKWLIYVLGIITGIVLTFSFAYCVNQHRKSGLNGLELLENPEENMGYSMLKVFQVIDSGYALALADGHYDSTVLLIPNEKQQFYDDQEIVLKTINAPNAWALTSIRMNLRVKRPYLLSKLSMELMALIQLNQSRQKTFLGKQYLISRATV